MILLASGSPRRRELLTQIGAEFTVEPSAAKEIKNGLPSVVVKENALLKAKNAAAKHKNTWVLGADTVVALDGKVYGKPVDKNNAISMLHALSGRTHEVYTGIALVYNDKIWQDFAMTGVEISSMTDKEIKTYLKRGEPMDKAGAYAIQGKFAVFVKKIEGSYSNVVGLPLSKLYELCKKAGCVLY